MDTTKDLIASITRITTELETEHPELYRYLDENPTTLPAADHPKINPEVLKNYLETLTQLLNHYRESHRAENAK